MSGDGRLLGPLRNCRPIGLDGRQVQDVEAKVRHVVEPGDDIVERSMTLRIGRGRAREELVPGGEASPHRVDDGFQRPIDDGCPGQIRVAIDERAELLIERRLRGQVLARPVEMRRVIGTRGTGRGSGHDAGADLQIDG